MDYYPSPLAADTLENLAMSLKRELEIISAAINGRLESLPTVYRNTAPSTIFDGMIVGADGVGWNPGSGKGLYLRTGAVWRLL